LWLGTAPLVSGLIGYALGLRHGDPFGIAFFSHQPVVHRRLRRSDFDAMGSYDAAWKISVIGVTAGIAQMFMDAKPTPNGGRCGRKITTGK
jgi:hypothetical protein